jgi:branched-chain amino acid transport system permease protein
MSAPGPAAPALLNVADLVCEFGGVLAVNRASLEVQTGQVVGLMGPNGAGKSTLLGAVAGAIAPSSGSVTFNGEDVTRLRPDEMAQRGLVRTFQLSSEFAGLTVMENLLVGDFHMRGERLREVAFGRRVWGSDEAAAVERGRELLQRFGMQAKEDELAGLLSGGQKRILELLRALMSDPKLLLLDEPMAGVHPNVVDRIVTWLMSLREQNITVVLTEHELGVLERVCDSVFVMANGRVIAEGTIANVRRLPEVLDAYLVK